KEAKKKAESSSSSDIARIFEEAQTKLARSGDVRFGAYANAALDQKGVNELIDRLRAQSDHLAIGVFGRQGDRVPWVVSVTGKALERGVAAKDFVAVLKQNLAGGGGGSPEKAQGQGTLSDGIAPSIAYLERELERVLASE